MVEVLKRVYWSKSEAFLLPLTGLVRSRRYPIKTYLFWNKYSIENYQLIAVFNWTNYYDFLIYCKRSIFPVLDKNGYLIESYDGKDYTVYVLDISEWALDIEMFLRGKYSKMSNNAKEKIVDYHTFYDKEAKILIEIQAAIEPLAKYSILDNMTAIEYVAENYGLPLNELSKIGELGSIYDIYKETLYVDI